MKIKCVALDRADREYLTENKTYCLVHGGTKPCGGVWMVLVDDNGCGWVLGGKGADDVILDAGLFFGSKFEEVKE